MKRVTLNQLANQMEEDLGWYDYFVGQVYNGNHSHCKEVLNSLSKKETLEVIRVCVDELDESENSEIGRASCRDRV